MKRMVRICVIILLVVLFVPMSVRADVIYEPFNDFYMEHREDCTYIGRSYTTNGPNGNVTLYGSPTDPRVEKTYSNGIALYVSYTYQTADGILWGCCDNWDDDVTGWAPMEYLELIYDEQSFTEEYGDQFTPVQITLDAAELTGKTVYFWEYPGSCDHIAVELSADYRPDFRESYVDANGVEWLRCGYFMGIRGKWINLNDPTADYETLFPDAGTETAPSETEPAVTEPMEEIKPAGNREKIVVIVAVAAVVAITAVMLVLLKKKQK